MRLSFSGMMMRKRSRSKATFSIYRNAAVTLQRQTPDSILFSVCFFLDIRPQVTLFSVTSSGRVKSRSSSNHLSDRALVSNGQEWRVRPARELFIGTDQQWREQFKLRGLMAHTWSGI